jgi:hypothetical protein
MYEGNGRSVRVGSHFDCIRESYCKCNGEDGGITLADMARKVYKQ